MTVRRVGVRIAGTGSQLPSKRLHNVDLEKLMETNDEWIVQRTGIRERRIIDKDAGESTATLSTAALKKALDAARMQASELDLIMCATMTPEMPCPATACLISERIGAGRAGAMDLNAACSGFVFGLNLCHDLIKGGSYRNIALIGADTVSEHMHYCTAGRGTAIIFGDAAGAAILRATDDPGLGVLAQSMHADGKGWKDIYIPYADRDFPPGVEPDENLKTYVQMNGAAVFKFAVGTFSNLIAETLEKSSVKPEQVDMFVCHQSNARILHSARERFGLPPEKLYVNIDRVGNTVGASVPLCLDELVQQGRVKPGMKVMFVAFGGGLTWGSSLWQL
jgi:3-oxoacyl-[acyl-carrier-protein] synthase III